MITFLMSRYVLPHYSDKSPTYMVPLNPLQQLNCFFVYCHSITEGLIKDRTDTFKTLLEIPENHYLPHNHPDRIPACVGSEVEPS